MQYWKKLIVGKIVVASKGNSAGKINVDIRVIAVQTEVKNFPILDLGILPDIDKQNWQLCNMAYLQMS